MIRRTATGTADIPPEDWHDRLPAYLAEIATLLIPPRRERTCPHAVKRARHNRLPGQEAWRAGQRPPPSTGHDQHTRAAIPISSMIDLRYMALRLGWASQ